MFEAEDADVPLFDELVDEAFDVGDLDEQ